VKKNKLIWHRRVNSLQFRISNGRKALGSTKTLFAYLVREMRKEKPNDEVIADTIEKVAVMLKATDTALTSGEPVETEEDKQLDEAVA
jgi:hypothetical protein